MEVSVDKEVMLPNCHGPLNDLSRAEMPYMTSIEFISDPWILPIDSRNGKVASRRWANNWPHTLGIYQVLEPASFVHIPPRRRCARCLFKFDFLR